MHLFGFLNGVDISALALPLPVALAAVTTLGYVLGRRSRVAEYNAMGRSKRELRRARQVASELEKIARAIHKQLAQHHARVSRFKQRVDQISSRHDEAAWKELCREAKQMLTPTLQLANQIANAHDQIRQQSNHLLHFTEARTDPLTGVGNRRALDDALRSQFALMNRYELGFSVLVVDIDHREQLNERQGQLQGDLILQLVARLLDESVRETDLVARHGGAAFVVVMPQTGLEGASTFAEHCRQKVEAELPVTVSGGVAAAIDGDTADSLLARADSALGCAASAGRNCVYRHDGERIESILDDVPA